MISECVISPETCGHAELARAWITPPAPNAAKPSPTATKIKTLRRTYSKIGQTCGSGPAYRLSGKLILRTASTLRLVTDTALRHQSVGHAHSRSRGTDFQGFRLRGRSPSEPARRFPMSETKARARHVGTGKIHRLIHPLCDCPSRGLKNPGCVGFGLRELCASSSAKRRSR